MVTNAPFLVLVLLELKAQAIGTVLEVFVLPNKKPMPALKSTKYGS